MLSIDFIKHNWYFFINFILLRLHLLLVRTHITLLSLHLKHFIPMTLIYALLKMKMMFCGLLKMTYFFSCCICHASPCLSCLAIAWNYFEILKCEYFGTLLIAMIWEMFYHHADVLILTCYMFYVCSVWMMNTYLCYILVIFFCVDH